LEKSLKKRVITGIVLGIVIFASIFNYTTAIIVIIAFILIGLYEFFQMLENKGIYPFKIFGMIIGFLIPLSISLSFSLKIEHQFFFVISGLIFLFLLQFLRRSTDMATVGISTTIFGILYISWCLSFLIRIRQLPYGEYLLLGIILITKSADSIAYIVGSLWGKHLLIKRISPKKTWEGSLAAFFTSILVSVLCKGFMGFSLSKALICGMLVGILGQLGDLSESLIKRDCGVKDSGQIPGLGGVLDILDSIIFVSPAFYLFLKVF